MAVRGPLYVHGVDLRDIEHELRERIDAFPPAIRAELLHVLMLPDFDRADRIGDYWASGVHVSRQFADLLIDLEANRDWRTMVLAMLRERERRGWQGDV